MPDQKIINPSFSNMELELEQFIMQYMMSDKVLHTIAKTMGYYDAGEQYKFLRVNSSGELLVSTEAGQVSTGITAQVTVTGVATLLLGANTSRVNALIFNHGTEDIYIGFSNGVTTALGFLLPVGMSWSTDVYIGDIYAIRAGLVSCTVSVMEL